jgi:hypothetical protein
MKTIRSFKTGLVVSLIMLTISACGKNGTTTTNPQANTAYGTCAPATGANVYTGNIVSCQDAGFCAPNETVVTGSVVLSVYGSAGVTSGQATITGSLTMNGATYCCNSQGQAALTYPTAYEQSVGAVAILDNIVLICQPSATGTGYFGTYQSISLRIGASYYAQSTMITSGQRLIGDIEVDSGVQGLGGSTNSIHAYVE